MSIKTIIIGTLGIIVLLFGLAYLATKGQTPTPKQEVYTKEGLDRPKAEVLTSTADLGVMGVNDTKEAEFTIKNIGNKPLQILNINSSCNCTFGKIIYKNIETNEFGMHKQSGYVADIAPGESAIVKAIYKPYIMPVYGNVSRDVYISTNDPENAKLIFTLTTVVK